MRRDPIESEIEPAFSPGAFIRDGACFSLAWMAARLWRVQAMRTVDAGKSKYNEAAAAKLERAQMLHALRADRGMGGCCAPDTGRPLPQDQLHGGI